MSTSWLRDHQNHSCVNCCCNGERIITMILMQNQINVFVWKSWLHWGSAEIWKNFYGQCANCELPSDTIWGFSVLTLASHLQGFLIIVVHCGFLSSVDCFKVFSKQLPFLTIWIFGWERVIHFLLIHDALECTCVKYTLWKYSFERREDEVIHVLLNFTAAGLTALCHIFYYCPTLSHNCATLGVTQLVTQALR